MAKHDFLIESKEGVIIKLHIQPKASREKFCGIYGDRLKLSVKAPPVDGKANEAIIKFLSKFLKVPKSNIILKSGANSKQKNFLLLNTSLNELQKKFSNLI